jgi:hypothetical protein
VNLKNANLSQLLYIGRYTELKAKAQKEILHRVSGKQSLKITNRKKSGGHSIV